jgi:hypothetical protein
MLYPIVRPLASHDELVRLRIVLVALPKPAPKVKGTPRTI